MDINICRFRGDTELNYDITESLRNRYLNQKFIYLGKGSSNYYDYDRNYWGFESSDVVTIDDWKNIIKKNLKINDDKLNFISIACGDSYKETKILEGLGIKNVDYIGVDYSEEMIKASEKNLSNLGINSYLIRSDISDIDFKRYLDNLVKRNERRFFSFLGNTFGNIKTTNVVDLLGSYLKSGDIVGIDITVKPSESVESSVNLFNHYREKTKNSKKWRDYILSGFKHINFPVEKGKILIETKEDKLTGLYRIIFYLEMLEDIHFELEGDIIILKGEKIKFYELYYYQPEKLINFMKQHRFKLLDNNIKNFRGQFLFEKE